MKTLKIMLDEQTATWLRVEAARAGKSMSRYVSDVLQERRASGLSTDAERAASLAVLERFLAGPGYPGVAAGLPTDRDELYRD